MKAARCDSASCPKRMHRSRWRFHALVALLALALTGPAAATLHVSAIEPWADDYFNRALAAGQINGASIGVVQHGNTVFLKGYGYEDQARGIAVDTAATRFRMCSISKTVTATAIMQLIERGEIASLDDPVNRYLTRYQLAPPGDTVTLRMLMTHSSGMAGHLTPQGTKLDLPVPVTAEAVRAMFLEDIERPPGVIGQYANLGVALESVLIEDVTGMSFADYVATNVLEPLGMTSAEMHHRPEPPPRLAVPYGRFPDVSLQAVPFYPKHPLTAASGGLMATPADMLRYASMHASGNASVLTDTSRREMERRQFGQHPMDSGIGLHWYPERYGDVNLVSHGCGLPGTRSWLGVVPDQGLGIVITVLDGAAVPGVGDLLDRLLGQGKLVALSTPSTDRVEGPPQRVLLETLAGALVRPAPTEAAEATEAAVDDPQQLTGSYWTERRSLTSFATSFAADSVLQVRAAGNTVEMSGRTYEHVAPGVYDSEDGRRLIFRRISEAGPVYMHTAPSSSWRRVSGWGDPTTVLPLMMVGYAVQLLAFGAFFWRGENPAAR